jgi:hypothetical protein
MAVRLKWVFRVEDDREEEFFVKAALLALENLTDRPDTAWAGCGRRWNGPTPCCPGRPGGSWSGYAGKRPLRISSWSLPTRRPGPGSGRPWPGEPDG